MPWTRVARIDGGGVRRVRARQRSNAVEPCPAHLAGREQPRYGGWVFFHLEEGRAGCGNPTCGWSGVPTRVAGVLSTRCPACEADSREDLADMLQAAALRPPKRRRPGVEQRHAVKVERNAPCPCGSGRKAKKCCHA